MAPSISACLAREGELKNVSQSARLDIELLLQHVLKKRRSFLYAWPEKILSAEHHDNFDRLLRRRIAGEPIAYIIGTQGFWSLDLDVNKSTLIPRPETELLVELALKYCSVDTRVLDLGTGTGAVALALACELPEMHIEAVDRVEDAVLLSQKNAAKNSINNIRFYRSNWFENVSERFDLIVSNPPYIEAQDPHLDHGDVRFEPLSALASGRDGLDDIRIICRHAPNYLFDQGILMVEHGWQQKEAVQELFAKSGFEKIETEKDLGRRDRVTYGFLKDV